MSFVVHLSYGGYLPMEFVDMGPLLVVVGIMLLLGLIRFRRRSRAWKRYRRFFVTVFLTIIVVLLFLTGSLLYWYTHHPVPGDIQRQLYKGVMYYRDVRSEPRPINMHIVTKELADVIIDYGGYTALNLDGGGSSTMVIEDEHGNPTIVNSPIANRFPGRERPVANHLGIYIDD